MCMGAGVCVLCVYVHGVQVSPTHEGSSSPSQYAHGSYETCMCACIVCIHVHKHTHTQITHIAVVQSLQPGTSYSYLWAIIHINTGRSTNWATLHINIRRSTKSFYMVEKEYNYEAWKTQVWIGVNIGVNRAKSSYQSYSYRHVNNCCPRLKPKAKTRIY